MAITILNDRIELTPILVNVSAIGGDNTDYSNNFYNQNKSLTFTLPFDYIENAVLTDTTNKIFVEGVNQQTQQRYVVEYNSDESTEYGSDWEEGYYRIYVRQYCKPTNGYSGGTLNNLQGSEYFDLTKKDLYWNKSQISFMTYVQPGKFWMGPPDGEIGRFISRETRHFVTISNAFYITRTLITYNFCNKILSGSAFAPANEYSNLGTASTEMTTYMSGTTERPTCFATGQTASWYGSTSTSNVYRAYVSYSKYNRTPGSQVTQTTGSRGGGRSVNGFITSSNIGYPPPYITGSYLNGETDRSILHAMSIKIPFVSSNNTSYVWDLPTEAQWEYSCRAGTKSAFNNGENLKFKTSQESGGSDTAPQPNINEVCWYKYHNNAAHPVAMLNPNNWGLFDCHGNAYEWVKDWYIGNNSNWTDGDNEIPIGSDTPTSIVNRGGGYNNYARYCRSSHRGYSYPSVADNMYGFRLVLHV